MGPRRIIVLLIALVAAGGTAMYARSWVVPLILALGIALTRPPRDGAPLRQG